MSDRLPHATIFADASIDPPTRVAGYGAWIISRSKYATTVSGPMEGVFPNSNEAEIAALANALHQAAKLGYLAPGATVMLQSDNVHALGVIRHHFNAADRPMKESNDGIAVGRIDPKCWGERPKPKSANKKYRRRLLSDEIFRKALAAMQRVVTAYQLTLVVRHVRGHRHQQGLDGDTRAWVNRECDRLAHKGKAEALRRRGKEAENV